MAAKLGDGPSWGACAQASERTRLGGLPWSALKNESAPRGGRRRRWSPEAQVMVGRRGPGEAQRRNATFTALWSVSGSSVSGGWLPTFWFVRNLTSHCSTCTGRLVAMWST
eukprot:CAMPEP_0170406560 /NCGR_PEP_ID=MMETSP0117_2-20130122/27785_1 /TAXON_ID=400756 /ORGANISM="Durinskia baltica, Strain CSIRO CS-38" /LENGTH=110 /DNA_ID=CAMNT_0010663761 /DNA_START=325 /DNA_END=653 /DNA_ORIENTATION=+